MSWTADFRQCAFHHAWCMCTFPQQGQHADAALREQAFAIGKFLSESQSADASNLSGPYFAWMSLLSLAAVDSQPDAVANGLAKQGIVLAGERRTDNCTKLLSALCAVFKRAHPDYDRQLSLRVGPFLQQWEAMGPGLMFQVSHMAAEQGIEPPKKVWQEISINMLTPLLGGFGRAFPDLNAVQFEAVLANANPLLPETLRMAWLLSQVLFHAEDNAMDQSRPSDAAGGTSQADLQWIVPVLRAGEELGLTQVSASVVEAALATWLPERTFADKAKTSLELL